MTRCAVSRTPPGYLGVIQYLLKLLRCCSRDTGLGSIYDMLWQHRHEAFTSLHRNFLLSRELMLRVTSEPWPKLCPQKSRPSEPSMALGRRPPIKLSYRRGLGLVKYHPSTGAVIIMALPSFSISSAAQFSCLDKNHEDISLREKKKKTHSGKTPLEDRGLRDFFSSCITSMVKILPTLVVNILTLFRNWTPTQRV